MTSEDMAKHWLKRELDVSRETISKLEGFVDLVERWTKKINLISAKSAEGIWHRHVLDSAQLWPIAPTPCLSWLDIGSGGGFPGIVLAIIAEEKSPDCHFTLVESDIRKSVFLRAVARDLRLHISVLDDRIESVPAQSANVISARALAPLKRLLDLCERHISTDTVCLFPKGRQYADELAEAHSFWRFEQEILPSCTDPEAAILKLSELKRV